MSSNQLEQLETEIEKTVGNLYGLFYRLRENGFYQEEYDNMSTLIKVLTEDRNYLRKKHGVTP